MLAQILEVMSAEQVRAQGIFIPTPMLLDITLLNSIWKQGSRNGDKVKLNHT